MLEILFRHFSFLLSVMVSFTAIYLNQVPYLSHPKSEKWQRLHHMLSNLSHIVFIFPRWVIVSSSFIYERIFYLFHEQTASTKLVSSMFWWLQIAIWIMKGKMDVVVPIPQAKARTKVVLLLQLAFPHLGWPVTECREISGWGQRRRLIMNG